MIGPGRYDPPTIYKGLTWPDVTLIWKDLDGAPFDLTGWQAFAETINGFSLNARITDPLNGKTIIGLGQATTSVFQVGEFAWDWVWKSTVLGIKYPPLLQGIIVVKQPKTHVFFGEIPPGPQ